MDIPNFCGTALPGNAPHLTKNPDSAHQVSASLVVGAAGQLSAKKGHRLSLSEEYWEYREPG